MVERRELARGQRGRHEAWAVGEHVVHALGDGGGVGYRQDRVGAGGVVGHEHAVEAGKLVRLGEVAHIAAVDHRAAGGVSLRHFLRLDHADEFDAHGASWVG